MGRRSATQLVRQKLIDKVKSNNLDSTSCEVQSTITFIIDNYFLIHFIICIPKVTNFIIQTIKNTECYNFKN